MTSVTTHLPRLIAALAAGPLLAAFTQGSTMAHDDWIQTSAISWSGGVRVASGDVKGGATAAGDEHEFEYEVVAGKAPPPRGPGSMTSGGTARPAAGTRLAQFAINGNALGACRVGKRYPTLRLSDGRRRWQLSDVAVVRCGGGKMTVSYASRQAR